MANWNHLYVILNLCNHELSQSPQSRKQTHASSEKYTQGRHEFNWKMISANINITPEIINAHPNWNWDYSSLCYNPNTTWDLVRKILPIVLSYETLFKHSCKIT